ncbi:hypothetical protein O9K51_08053 [Purpureocillium lavendulum]|uniref:SET domain-containing protein n=1 Tax=Purpureocillium lavendulum TaxID=1247861 RepID=A0AB34FP49_9HYPO|nr:hypothetical protein O9K51_08053 [Purpureocillium lavendulum]
MSLNVLGLFRPCEGSPAFQEEYRGAYVPEFIETDTGRQIVAPDTPYVAAVGHNQLNIEKALVSIPNEYVYIDPIAATAERRNSVTDETTFAFDPPYARVFFARAMNKRNPLLKLPEHARTGSGLVAYNIDLGTPATLEKKYLFCDQYGCYSDADCKAQTHSNCPVCSGRRVDNECEEGYTNGLGYCHPLCNKAVDTPRHDGETDADYYQRMDKLHWGGMGHEEHLEKGDTADKEDDTAV